MRRIDLNADAGESFGAWTLGADAALFEHVTSVSIACGFHAGDPTVIRRTLRLARGAGVAVGAHPGLPDLQGFGRRALAITPRDAEDLVLYQVAALTGMAAAEGVRLAHVKPHGALYNMAARDDALAGAIARAVRLAGPALLLFAMAGSALEAAGLDAGLHVVPEAFADRAYRADGTLAPRDSPGAVLESPEAAVVQAVSLARDGVVRAGDGLAVTLQARTLCIHGDTPGAPALARQVRAALEQAGIVVAPPDTPVT